MLERAGLAKFRFHDLRHTFATMALQNGVDVKTVSSMLGHYDAGFTLRTYTHATRQMQQKAAETATDLEAFQAQLAAARAAETAALPTSGGIVDGTILHTNATEVAASDAELLAAIIECEAYQDYNSLLAVATVIMNRLEDPRFPNTIPEIIYATNQFEPVSRGMLDVVLARGASDLSRQVAQDALNGARLQAVSDCYFFLYAGATSHPGVNVGGNVFFQSW